MRAHGAWLCAAALAAAGACGGDHASTTQPVIPPPPPAPAADTTPLRVLAARHSLLIGAAVDRGFRYTGSDSATFRALLAKQFSVLTPENDMKWDHIHPARNTYRFEPADSIVAFAEANGMKVRGHNLAWHSQLPAWLTSGTWTPAEATALLDDHIATVVGHYRGRVMEWDVVNEALNDDGTKRSSFWLANVGPGYIERAFRDARAADSAAGLFYNDYNIEGMNAKSDSLYAMMQDFKARGVPVTGVGFESHFQLGGVPSSLAANIARFAGLGLKVHITELDVRMLLPATSTQLDAQASDYTTVVSACMQTTACDLVTIWGVSDRESWIPGTFPGWGAATLFDAQYQSKPAYAALVKLLQ